MDANQIKTLYQEALSFQNGGQPREALKRYGAILEARPNLAEVHFQVGRIFVAAQDHDRGLAHLLQARQLKPGELAIWQAQADAIAAKGDAKMAETLMTEARRAGMQEGQLGVLRAKLAPGAARSKMKTGGASRDEIETVIGLIRNGEADEAIRLAATIHRKFPKVAVVANVYASALAMGGQSEKSLELFRKAIALNPDYAEAHNNYGRQLLAMEKIDEAIIEFRKALILVPRLAEAILNLGSALAKMEEDEEAEKHLYQASKLMPDHPGPQFDLAKVLHRLRRYDEAVTAAEKSIELGYNRSEAYSALGSSLLEAGRTEEAYKVLKTTIELNPDSANAHIQMALYFQRVGDFEAAEASARRAIEISPGTASFYNVLTTGVKLGLDDPCLEGMKKLATDSTVPDAERRMICFALSKVMEDNKNYGEVFTYLRTANDLTKREFPYDIANRRREIDGLKRCFENFDPKALTEEGRDDYAPIFVTGMPRSGTTLIEQIIASHSTVTGAGELGTIIRQAYALAFRPDRKPRTIDDISEASIAELGRNYAATNRKAFPDTPRITDKSIQSYAALGLIKLALPKARFIIVRRDPKDNLLSIYKNTFVEGTHGYAYNLTDLGIYYKMFVEMIDFWRERVPDWIYEVQYEDLIANPEEESRKLIAAAGLEWEDQCLNFHENKRRVDTLSVYQVRQPMYSSSVKSWQRYEDDLQELFEALK